MNTQGFVLMPIKNHQCGFNNIGLCRSELHIQSNPIITPRIIIKMNLHYACRTIALFFIRQFPT